MVQGGCLEIMGLMGGGLKSTIKVPKKSDMMFGMLAAGVGDIAQWLVPGFSPVPTPPSTKCYQKLPKV